MWIARDLPGKVIDITPSLVGENKGVEIVLWLSEHGKQDTRYVIIDDEYVILDPQVPHFILTNPYEGITEEQANRAISMLNE